jgi:TonB family protein
MRFIEAFFHTLREDSMYAVFVSLLLAQTAATPAPAVTACPTVEIERIPEAGAPDPEWRGSSPASGVLAIVAVVVNPDGSLKDVRIFKSTGTPDGDHTALLNAAHSVYRPKQVNCENVQGTYHFRELFPNAP